MMGNDVSLLKLMKEALDVPCTKRAAFFLSELEAKPMPHCTSRGKMLHIHI